MQEGIRPASVDSRVVALSLSRRVPTPPGRAPFPRDSGEHDGSGALSRVNAASSHLPLLATSSPCRICYARRINDSMRLSVLSFGLGALAATNEHWEMPSPPTFSITTPSRRLPTTLQITVHTVKADTEIHASGSCRIPRCAHAARRRPE